jgi:hypothetical protein
MRISWAVVAFLLVAALLSWTHRPSTAVASAKVGASCAHPWTWKLSQQQVSALNRPTAVDQFNHARHGPVHAYSYSQSLYDYASNSVVGSASVVGWQPNSDAEHVRFCTVSGTGKHGARWTMPSNEGGAGAEALVDPDRLTGMTFTYAHPSRQDGASCANPYIAWFPAANSALSLSYGAKSVTGVKAKFINGDVGASGGQLRLRLSWSARSGYRLCKVVIAQDGKAMFTSKSRTGEHVAEGSNLHPVQYAYVTVAKS